MDRLLLAPWREITKLQESMCERPVSNANDHSLGTGVSSKNTQGAIKCTCEYAAFL